MKKQKALLVLLASVVCNAHAAVTPKHQNAKDLKVMLAFVKSHKVVLGNLESINIHSLTVEYTQYNHSRNTHCIASFTRKLTPFAVGDLIFESSTCKLKEKK